jgi:hypothetical protein
VQVIELPVRTQRCGSICAPVFRVGSPEASYRSPVWTNEISAEKPGMRIFLSPLNDDSLPLNLTVSCGSIRPQVLKHWCLRGQGSPDFSPRPEKEELHRLHLAAAPKELRPSGFLTVVLNGVVPQVVHNGSPKLYLVRAPTGRPNPAQAIGLVCKDQAMRQAMTGRTNTCRHFFPDSPFMPTDTLNVGFLKRPIRARS